jgi:hypothetical protein
MFADPITIGVAGTSKTFARTGISPTSGTFSYDDGAGLVRNVIIKQNDTKARFRREIRVTQDSLFTNPVSGITAPVSASVYLVVDEPKAGFVDGTLNDMVVSLTTFLTSSSGANTMKLLGGEY